MPELEKHQHARELVADAMKSVIEIANELKIILEKKKGSDPDDLTRQ